MGSYGMNTSNVMGMQNNANGNGTRNNGIGNGTRNNGIGNGTRNNAGVGAGANGNMTMSQAQSDRHVQRALRTLQAVNMRLTSQGYTSSHVRAGRRFREPCRNCTWP